MARQIDFADGAQTSTVPTIGNIVASDLVTYADDAAYEAAESGAPAEGNIYFNTTDNVIRYYNGTVWQSIVDETTSQVVENKTIDGTSATGNNTVTIDADNASYDNSTSGLTATDAQAAIDEVEGRVDAAEADILTNAGDINDLETLSGSPGATDHGTFTGSTISDNETTKGALQELETAVEDRIPNSEKGAANGVATLDGSGQIPASQIPTNVLTFEGSYDASGGGSGSPSLTDGSGNTGQFYRVSAAGTVDHGAGSVTYAVGDSVVYNGSVWEKYDEQTLADTDSLPEGSTNLYYTEARVDANSSVVANTAKVSADGSIDTHSDVDTTTAPPSVNDVLSWDGSNWVPAVASSGSDSDFSNLLQNVGLQAAVAANELTVSLKQADGSTDPASGSSKATLGFRNATVGSGGYALRDVTSSLSITVPNTATLGTASGVLNDIFVYALDNAGTVELAISTVIFDELNVQSTTAISASADVSLLYSTVSRSNVPIRLIGRLVSTQPTAGVWTVAPSLVVVGNKANRHSINYISTQSSIKTPAATNHYNQLTGNTLTLTPGTWELSGNCIWERAAAVGYTFNSVGWFSGNGNDTITTPALLTAATSITIQAGGGVSAPNAQPADQTNYFEAVDGDPNTNVNSIELPRLRVFVDDTTVIYAVPFTQASTPANARVWTNLYAARVL